MDNDLRNLLLAVARCPVATDCLTGNASNACTSIVGTQGADQDDFQLPEPWTGHLDEAPILFIASNPSISPHEIFPRGDWADDQIVAFFQDRFDSGGGWMSGLRTLLADGTYAERSNHYYAQTRARASELLGRTAILGRDVAFTEVVHCKSRKEAGVADALDECATRYLTAILAASPARVFIVAGRAAQSAFERAFSSVRVAEGLAGPIEIAGRQRMVAYLPHPSGAFGPRTFAACLPHGLPQLRRWLEGAPGLP